MNKTKIISFACQKGGVGKTTTAASLGGLLALSHQRVLLVDLDPQGNLAMTFQNKEYERTIFDALNERKNLPIEHIRENLDLVPPGSSMSTIPTTFPSNILSDLLDEVKNQYDWILIDCPPEIGTKVANAMAASTHVVIPMCCDRYSVTGVRKIMEFIDMVKDRINPKLRVAGIVITRFNGRRRTDIATASALQSISDGLVFDTRIRENAAISQAPFSSQDIATYKPGSTGALDYKDLLLELLMKLK